MTDRRLTANEITAELARRVDVVVPALFKNAQKRGNHFFVGDLDDNQGDSLYVHRRGGRCGVWCDCATGEKGDLLGLVKAVRRLSTAEACKWALEFLGLPDDAQDIADHRGPKTKQGQREQDRLECERSVVIALSIWWKRRPITGTVADEYLRQVRGITIPPPPTLGFVSSLWHCYSGRSWPAIVAAVQGPDRRIRAVHRTFLAPDGSGKAPVEKSKMMLGEVCGNATRLAAAAPEMAVGEGLETCLSFMQETGIATWAALSAHFMPALILPPLPLAAHVYLLVDIDRNRTGEKNAAEAGRRLIREGRKITLARPTCGKDINDAIRTFQRAAADVR